MITSRTEQVLFRTPPFCELLLRLSSRIRRTRGAKNAGRGPKARRDEVRLPKVPENEIRRFLTESGVTPDSVVMVHSDSNAIESLGWPVVEFLDFLQAYVSPHGTLMMPSHAKLQKTPEMEIYDPSRCPSTVGLLTELFRRRSGVRRSLFPLSPAAAWGPLAAELIDGHRHSFAPHDEKSPYYKMVQQGGQIVCIGVPLDRMTLIHVAEDTLRESFPIEGFYEKKTYGMRLNGSLTTVNVHSRAKWLWWYLAKYRWSREICRRGFVRGINWNGVLVRVANASSILDWMTSEIMRGRTIYPLASWNSWLTLGDPATGGQL